MDSIPINADDSPLVVLELIYQLKVKDVMTTAVISGSPDDTIRKVQAIMRENYITGMPIVDSAGLLAGMISLSDIISALDGNYIEESCGKYMTRNLIVLEDDMPLSFAISYINKYRYGRFPVVNKNKNLVGILTSKDVVRTLLVEMNREVLRLENTQGKHENAGMFKEMEFAITKYDFETAGRASTEIKKTLKKRDIDPQIIRRVSIASYELEINVVVHSEGGVIHCSIQPDRIIITAKDRGPGIADVNLALQEGWSTANEWIRSLGFGAGMGLANTKRVSDEFEIASELGKGTTVVSTVYIVSPKQDDPMV
ncbi:MAG: CBS domain-containing protein [Spirochaetaceae bacterium]|jgi:CBS domain-containing protein/anti-sigma regulatory factor (Ser/Thr protein kinase)|nr:CBS domain-containing protein [Spirochaetaceae bacterium]